MTENINNSSADEAESSSEQGLPVGGTIRLNRYLSECGVCSRRKADELIAQGKVKVNGQVVSDLNTKVNPGRDIVLARGRRVSAIERGILLLHKPTGVVSTLEDPEGRPTVGDFLDRRTKGYFPIGRLDWDTSGLVILTNDGDLANRLAHPRFGFERVYEVKVKGQIPEWAVQKIERGVKLEDGFVKAKVVVRGGGVTHSWLQITVVEGRNRLVRRIFERVGYPVLKLKRVRFGPFHLGKLRIGQVQPLTEKDYERFRSKVFDGPKASAEGAEEDNVWRNNQASTFKRIGRAGHTDNRNSKGADHRSNRRNSPGSSDLRRGPAGKRGEEDRAGQQQQPSTEFRRTPRGRAGEERSPVNKRAGERAGANRNSATTNERTFNRGNSSNPERSRPQQGRPDDRRGGQSRSVERTSPADRARPGERGRPASRASSARGERPTPPSASRPASRPGTRPGTGAALGDQRPNAKYSGSQPSTSASTPASSSSSRRAQSNSSRDQRPVNNSSARPQDRKSPGRNSQGRSDQSRNNQDRREQGNGNRGRKNAGGGKSRGGSNRPR